MRPIWESASRPLFVRSVWQEAIGRRHFILDYEPRQRQRWKRQKTRLRGNYQQTESYEILEQSVEDSVEYLDEYLLLDATKLTLQQQQSLPTLGGRPGPAPSTGGGHRGEQRHQSRQSKRRAWLLSRGRTYNMDHHHHMDHQSRRSSLQDATSTLSTTANNPEERLAERVLHWLDLAGRTDIVKEKVVVTPPATSSAQLARSAQRMQRSHHRSMSLKRVAAAAVHHQRSVARKPVAKPAPVAQQVTSSSLSASNAKPITIIFNKEGVPVRLNRPARNIDLCTLSSSASTTRRLAGQLASARLYSGATASPLPEDSRTPPLSGRGMGSSAASDSRKQLHIFMPSLPKKGLLAAGSTPGSGIGGSGEDALSTSFSELCQL
ncbi:uncharacterized protein LOC120446491 [Drosophila santomea]|uniref:uncharacterized protein LOC120446491 n=1 Tax=Drosophila santomea TaxID=129105 RepID=UPI001952ACCB|nr:uncharacterized protein LOC120446491 [Drosophila santomea]